MTEKSLQDYCEYTRKTNIEFIYTVVLRVVTSQDKFNLHSRENHKYQE